MYISVDGDNIGSSLENLIILEKSNELRDFSQDIFLFFEAIKKELIHCGAEIIFHGGDSILAKTDDIDSVSIIDKVFSESQNYVERRISVSVGLGESMLEAYLALKAAKTSGKCCWIKYPELSKPHKFLIKFI
jgi:GTP cyclohydrolase III